MSLIFHETSYDALCQLNIFYVSPWIDHLTLDILTRWIYHMISSNAMYYPKSNFSYFDHVSNSLSHITWIVWCCHLPLGIATCHLGLDLSCWFSFRWLPFTWNVFLFTSHLSSQICHVIQCDVLVILVKLG